MVGIVGTGSMGLYHAASVEACGHIVACGSAQSAKSESWNAFQKCYPSARFQTLEDILADKNIDAVIVSLPWNVVETVLPKLLRSPKPMLIEKPIALRSSTLIDATADTDIILDNKYVGFNRRFYTTVERLHKRIQNGGLKAVEVTISVDIDKYMRSKRADLIPYLHQFDSVHTLDLLLYLFGDITVIKMYPSTNKDRPAEAVSYNGLLEARGIGVPVTLALNMSDPSPAGIRCRFDDETTWVLSPLETLTIYDRYEIKDTTLDDPIRRYLPHAREQIEEPRDNKPGFNEQARAFLLGNSKRASTIEDSIQLLKLIESFETSTRNI